MLSHVHASTSTLSFKVHSLIHTHTHTHIHTRPPHTHTHTHTHTHIHTHTQTHTPTHKHNTITLTHTTQHNLQQQQQRLQQQGVVEGSILSAHPSESPFGQAHNGMSPRTHDFDAPSPSSSKSHLSAYPSKATGLGEGSVVEGGQRGGRSKTGGGMRDLQLELSVIKVRLCDRYGRVVLRCG